MKQCKYQVNPWPIPYETYAYVKLTERAATTVFDKLGPGLKEKSYEKCLAKELGKKGLNVRRQVNLPVIYDGEKIGDTYRVDLLLEDDLIIEVKAVDRIIPLHYLQVRTYLRVYGKRVGMLINFNCEDIADGLKRVVIH